MNLIKNFINQEVIYFRNLQHDAQRLLFSIFLNNLIDPMLGLFLNAFLWRQSHDLQLVAFYNLIVFSLIAGGFYLNGILLKKFSPKTLFFLALIIFGFATSLLIFLPKFSYLTILFFGIIDGLCAGVYWGNRNLLTLKTTQSDNRIYFSSIETASGTITNVFVPLFIGWFIAFGDIIHLYSPIHGYQILSLLMLLIIGVIAIIMRTISIKQYAVGRLFVTKVSQNWQKFRLIQFVWGLNNGVTSFIPALLILILVGQEATLGTVQSASAIFTSILVFTLAKYLHIKHRLPLILTSAAFLIVGAGIFGLLYSALGVFILIASQGLAASLEWVAFSSLNYDLIDKDGEAKINHYAYVCDQEIYLNGGRVIAILLFIAIIHFGSKELALRFSPFIVAILQIFAYLFAKSIEKPTQI